MSIDLGNTPVGDPPSSGEQAQIRTAIGAASASQGTKADSALQPGDSIPQTDVTGLTSDLNTRARDGGVWLDGVSGEIDTRTTWGDDGDSLAFKFTLGAADTFAQILSVGGSGNFLFGFWDEDDQIVVRRLGSANINVDWLPEIGKTYHLYFERSVDDLLIYVDGDLADTVSAAFSGVSSGNVVLGSRGGSHFINGGFSEFAPFDTSLTALDLLSNSNDDGLAQIGLKEFLARNPALKKETVTYGASSWSNQSNTWDTFSSTDITGFEATDSGGSTDARLVPDNIRLGAEYEISFSVDAHSGGNVDLTIFDTVTFGSYATIITVTGTGDYSVRFTNLFRETENPIVRFASSSATALTISDFTVKKLGALTALDFSMGTGYYVPDLSGNGNYALLSENGAVWTDPKASGYIIEPNVDAYNAGAGNVDLISSLRPILPEGAMLTRLSIWNQNTAEVTGTLDVKLTTGGAGQLTGDTVTLNMAGKSSVVRGNTFALDMADSNALTSLRPNVALTASDSEATNLAVRIDYIVLDPSLT
ncbi:MAG: hypothetical protein AAGJ81_10715 [Verrucomicrobiota bacterium]